MLSFLFVARLALGSSETLVCKKLLGTSKNTHFDHVHGNSKPSGPSHTLHLGVFEKLFNLKYIRKIARKQTPSSDGLRPSSKFGDPPSRSYNVTTSIKEL